MNTKIFSFVLPTKIVFGAGCRRQLASALGELGVGRPLVVTDRGVLKAGILDRILTELPSEMARFAADGIFSGVEPNPKDRDVAAAAEAYRSVGADCLLAVGGGSPIDCAKAAGVLIALNATDIHAVKGRAGNAAVAGPPLICIPTTAGTGSEITFSSVITDTKYHIKMTVKNASTAAKVALCDPELTLSVPPATTAATGMDALTHAIEAFTAKCSEPIADALALYAMELIYPNLERAVRDGADLEARTAMLMGSLLAGMAFSHSDVASVHCIAEALGGMYDLPHGVCNAVILPYMMEYNLDWCVERYARVADAFGLTGYGQDAAQRARQAVDAVRELAVRVGLPAFSELGVRTDDFRALAVNSYRNNSTLSNPRPMQKRDYLNMLCIMQG